ncbi:hypothetical protein PHABIO_178 [Pseudomonas phage Phabio]|uniref:Uncharacterized protein n=1 Tax=Pseudomonas phage Phabio TaxID=2006668 RepID=A0A1Y0SZ70_9CAUD|nr:hypothetical protein MZD05_gp178 [Pseudomonas phage Phabio]ARV76809.1 hypothetical protein PHABIO_178 [Pseudomonas phage Phabio]
MQIKVETISDVTDLDYLKRRIEALYFEVKRFDKTLFISYTSASMNADAGFRLARLLHNNDGLVVYELDNDTKQTWEIEDSRVKKEA